MTLVAVRWTRVAAAMVLLLTSLTPVGSNSAPLGETAPIQPGQKTIWDGIFTEEQAARGRQHYRQFCSTCHSTDLSGGGDGEPGLVGETFMGQWRQRELSELFAFVSERMPFSAPGTLQRQQYIDIVSYILKENRASSGVSELPFDLERLKQIMITDAPAVQPGR
jgi:mono/diheme cytochrome c family protein